MKEEIKTFKNKIHGIMDKMGQAIKKDYGEDIACEYQGKCDSEIDKFCKSIIQQIKQECLDCHNKIIKTTLEKKEWCGADKEWVGAHLKQVREEVAKEIWNRLEQEKNKEKLIDKKEEIFYKEKLKVECWLSGWDSALECAMDIIGNEFREEKNGK